jgi:trehalose 6-phosphate synthase/phosphatase
VSSYDVYAWATAFVDRLRSRVPGDRHHVVAGAASLAVAVDEAIRARRVHLLLDYDGTLVPIADAPELATPDGELMALLTDLTECDELHVHLVSGRPREWLDDWFGHLPISLWAEHAFWHRPASGAPWEALAPISVSWRPRVEGILDQFTASTPGTRIESKSASIAWHYRQADPEFGARQAHELRMLLGDALSNQPLEVIEGKKVIEIRQGGTSKAAVAHRAVFTEGDGIIAAGDDRTDEELFLALPPSAVTIAVGSAPSAARYRVWDCDVVRTLLRQIVHARSSAGRRLAPLPARQDASTQPARGE